ncbi:MAG: hypothetical protein JSW58_09755, partial [Candidatus Latescibacterota bacterium]
IEQQQLVVRDANDGSRVFGISGTFPFVAGPMNLQLPSNQAGAQLISRIPSNVSTDESDLCAFDFVIRNGSSPGYTSIEFDGLRVRIKDAKGAAVNPTSILGGAYLVTNDDTRVDGQVNATEIVFTLPDNLVQIAPAQNETVSVFVDIDTERSDFNLRFVIEEPPSIDVSDVVTRNPVPAGAVQDSGFPLVTNWTHILGTDVQSAYTNYPNPFAAGREKTTITYYLEQKSSVTLKLYTIWGAPVITLLENKRQNPGLYQDVKWDGKNGDGDVVNNGVYYLVLEIRGDNGQGVTLKRKVGVIR